MLTDEQTATLINQSFVELQQDNPQQAWLLLQRARDEGSPHVELHVGFGAVYERLGELPHAYAAFDYAVSLGHNSAQAYNNRGRMAIMMGWLEEALADFQQALHWQPENARAHYNVGGILAQQGQVAAALASFQRAAALNYAPAVQAVNELQAQLHQAGPQLPADRPPALAGEEAFLTRALCHLASFAYATMGPNRRLSVVETKGLWGIGRKQQIHQQVRWTTTLEELHEVDKHGYQASRRGATLEIAQASPFLLRVTAGPAADCELAIWQLVQVPGVKQQTFKKVKEHVYVINARALALTLQTLLTIGVLGLHAELLVYPS